MTITPEERSLIAQAIKKDPEAFASLYLRFHGVVLRRVTAILGSREEAYDTASEAFLNAWNAIDRFQDRDVSIQAWFCTIAERLALRQLKQRRAYVDVELVYLEADPEEAPDVLYERGATVDYIRSAMVELPEIQRQVLSKRFLDELSYADVGALLDKPVGTVRVIQHRALKGLRAIILERQRREALAAATTGSQT